MERRATELLGKPIITFDTGRRLARVEDLLVDPERNQVLALLIDSGAILVDRKVIPFGHIQSIGANAVVVPKRGVVYKLSAIPALKRIFDGRTIKGMRVYSEAGDRLGTISDFFLDDHTGEIFYYEVSGGAFGDAMKGKQTIVPTEILNMGQVVLYVSPVTAARLEQQGAVGGALSAAPAPAAPGAAPSPAQTQALPQGSPAGWPALRTVVGADGQPLVQESEIISEQAVARAEQQDRLPALRLAAGLDAEEPPLRNAGRQVAGSLGEVRDELRRLWDLLAHHTGRLSSETDARMEQQRVDRALGRPASRVILDRQDHIILNTGDIITNAAVAQARAAGVLNILLDSVYTDKPRLGLADLKAPWAGQASLEETPPAPPPPAAAPPDATPAPPAAL